MSSSDLNDSIIREQHVYESLDQQRHSNNRIGMEISEAVPKTIHAATMSKIKNTIKMMCVFLVCFGIVLSCMLVFLVMKFVLETRTTPDESSKLINHFK